MGNISMETTRPQELNFASLKDLFSKFGFDCSDDVIRFKKSQKPKEKRGRKRQLQEKLQAVTTLSNWHIHANGNVDVEVQLDFYLLEDNLKCFVSRYFGTKSECEVYLCTDGSFFISVFCTQPSTKAIERGYQVLQREDDLPNGTFGFQLKVVSGPLGISCQIENFYSLGYVMADYLLKIPSWVEASFGIEGITQQNPAAFNFNEIQIDINALVCSSLEAKDNERRQATQLMGRWQKHNTQKIDYKIDLNIEHRLLTLKSVGGTETISFSQVPISTLEIRELVKQHPEFEKWFCEGNWESVAKYFATRPPLERSFFFQQRSALFVMMVRFPAKYPAVLAVLNSGKDTLESLSARIRVAESPSAKLSMLSKLTREIIEYFPDVESSRFVSLVFSEYLGDLWGYESAEMALQCYDKALEFAVDPGRILRKKKELFVQNHDYSNAIMVLDILAASEPRKVELSKLYIEKTEYLLIQNKIEEAIEFALLAATSDRHSSKAVILLAQAFSEAKKYTEAVQSLDDFLSMDHPGLSAKQQGEFNALIGEIWLKNLNAPEIALNRFISATALDPEFAPHFKLLSIAQEQVGLVQDQVSTLEKYLSMAEAQDDAAAVRWVNEKLIKIYSSGEGVFYSQRIAALRRLLAQSTPTFDEVLEIGQNFGSHDEWKIIVQTILERLPHVKSESEGGLICALLGEKSEDVLGDSKLASDFHRKAWDYKYLNSAIFRENFQYYCSIADDKKLADLCESWVDLSPINVHEVVRDCVERELPISPSKLDAWVVQSLENQHENIDLMISRLQTYVLQKNDSHVVSLWEATCRAEVGPLRRRKAFNVIKEFLIEYGRRTEVITALLWFMRNSEDASVVAKEAINFLDGRVSNAILAEFVGGCIEAGECPDIDDERVEKIFEHFPLLVRKFLILRATETVETTKKMQIVIRALGKEPDSPYSELEKKLVKDLFDQPEQTYWYGVESVSFFVFNSNINELVTPYLKFWIPQLNDKERDASFNLLIENSLKEKNDIRYCFSIAFNLMRNEESSVLIERISSLSKGLDFSERNFYIKNIIESEHISRSKILSAIQDSNAEDFSESMLSYVKDMKRLSYTKGEWQTFLRYSAKNFSQKTNRKIIDQLIDFTIFDHGGNEGGKFWFELIRELPDFRDISLDLIRKMSEQSVWDKVNVFSLLLTLHDIFSSDGQIRRLIRLIVERRFEFSSNSAEFRKSVEILGDFVPEELDIYFRLSKKAFLLEDFLSCEIFAKKFLDQVEGDLDGIALSSEDKAFLRAQGGPVLKLKVDLARDDSARIDSERDDSERDDSERDDSERDASEPRPGEMPGVQFSDLSSLNTRSEVQEPPSRAYKEEFVAELPTEVLPNQASSTNSKPLEKIEEKPHIEDRLVTSQNWRVIAASGKILRTDVSEMIACQFANPLEKHLAVQVFAILSGQVDKIESWPMRVWRDREVGNYSIGVEGRFPDELISKSILGPMAKLLNELQSFFVLVFKERLLLSGLAKYLRIKDSELGTRISKLDWSSRAIRRSGLSVVRERLEKKEYKFLNCTGLGKIIWFDAPTRTLVIDEAYYFSVPPSHLFHAVLVKYWEIKLRYQIFTIVDPIADLWPLVVLFRDFFRTKTPNFEVLKSIEFNGVALRPYLDKINYSKLSYFFDEIKELKQSELLTTFYAMQSHIHRIVVAETLDIVGMVEYLCTIDLLASNRVAIDDLFKASIYFQPLIKFSLQMKFNQEQQDVLGKVL